MPNYKFLLEYNGKDFSGSQIQNSAQALRTVQGELEKTLEKLLKTKIETTFAGRTDQGVHAIGQVVNFKFAESLEDFFKKDFSAISLMLNANLPDDMAITKIEEVNDNFNARFDATAREYLYKIFVRAQRPVLRTDSLAWFTEKLDFEKMQAHCQYFLGEQDFSRYCKEENNYDEEKNTICNVYQAQLIQESKICFKFHIKANRFLRNMVRRMVGELIYIGKGNTLDDKSACFTAPAAGLTLVKVEY